MREFNNEVTSVGDVTGGKSWKVNDRVASSSLRTYADDDETVAFVVAGTADGLVRETDDWETTEAPGPDGGVFALLTDRQVVFVVGRCRDPDVDGDYVRRVDLADVASVELESSFLSATFAVTSTEGVRLGLTPDDTDGLDEAVRYVERASRQWQAARARFEELPTELVSLEETIATGDETAATRQRETIQRSLTDLTETSALNAVELPALEADRDDARRQLEDALARGYWFRGREAIRAGDQHLDDGEIAAAAEAYRRACDAVESMVEFGNPRPAAFDEAEPDGDVDPFRSVDALLDRLASCTEQTASGESADGALATLETVEAGFNSLRSTVQFGGTALETDPEEVAERAADLGVQIAEACERAAAALETDGDDAYESGDDEVAADQYEAARDALEARAALAASVDGSATGEASERLRERLDEKIARSQWEWGGK